MSYVVADHLDKDQLQQQGAIYTPEELALQMARKLKLKEKQPILDPCCGKGNLFQSVLDTYDFISNEDLYGIDIDPEAIQFCIDKFPGGHFQVGNILEDNIIDDNFWKKDPLKKYKPTFISNFGKFNY